MAAQPGFGAFSGEPTEWEDYVERMENYFIAHDIKSDGKKRAVLLSECGAAMYKLIRSLVVPHKPSEVDYKELLVKAKGHFAPAPSCIVERYKFNTRVQQPSESVAAFVAQLRALSTHCEFGDMLEDMLRDRIVCGISDSRIQRRLLAEPKLTYAKAVELSQSMEAADKNSKVILPQTEAATVHVTRALCYRCGKEHSPDTCKCKELYCRKCSKKGHIVRVCRSVGGNVGRRRSPNAQDHAVKQITPMGSEEQQDPTYNLFNLNNKHQASNPILVTVTAHGQELQMEVDTGASLSLISEEAYLSVWTDSNRPPLQTTNICLQTYTGEKISVVGSLQVEVSHNNQTKQLPLLVVKGQGPSLLGRDWMNKLTLDWQTIHNVQINRQLDELLQKHSALFRDELGKLEGYQVKLHLDTEARPKFCKARSVPLALREKVEAALDQLETRGVIEKVKFSDWAAPIVPITKQDDTIRICGDYKLTVNKIAKPDVYPLPKIEELFTALTGGRAFSKLDLSQAYQQLVLCDESKPYTTINTHRGLYSYNRLPFGISAAPAIFQRTLETLLQGIPNVCVYLDDILVTGKTTKEHLDNLKEVLTRLETAGMRLKQQKCEFLMSEVEYLGHRISPDGLQPTPTKVKAIMEAPAPTNVSELKAFLGLVNYYGKFLSNLATTLAPLYKLLQKNVKWSWGATEKSAFEQIKKQLTSDSLLVHYDPNAELVLSCDASPYGVGAVLSHRWSEGTERPIAFASRTLAPAERRYAHLDKEALAIIFGLKHFNQYLAGQHFVIFSDHKPLMYLFSATKPTPTMASARIQRWALMLSCYDYEIQYRPGSQQANADACSRLPLPTSVQNIPTPAETVLVMEHLETTPVSAKQVRLWTQRDPVMSKVLHFTLQGWPNQVAPEFKPFHNRSKELSIEDNCIMWGNRVVIPPQGRQQLLDELYVAHPGIARMKNLARSYFWWPGLDSDIEQKAKQCDQCQINQKKSPIAPMHPWEWPGKPWSRIHLDYAGPFQGRMFLVMVDSHSKWLEVHVTHSASSAVTIEKIQTTFAALGLPETVVTDNGTCFTSQEFQAFLKQNGIQHVRTAAYHPSSNGLAERYVQIVKEGLKKITSGSIESRLARLLSRYRVIPQSTTGRSPAELMFGRNLRTRLDLLRPDVGNHVRHQQAKQKQNHDAHAKQRDISEGMEVYVFNNNGMPKWLPGIVEEITGPVSAMVKLSDGRTLRKHIDDLRNRSIQESNVDTNLEDIIPVRTELPVSPQLRRSTRAHKPPDRYEQS